MMPPPVNQPLRASRLPDEQELVKPPLPVSETFLGCLMVIVTLAGMVFGFLFTVFAIGIWSAFALPRNVVGSTVFNDNHALAAAVLVAAGTFATPIVAWRLTCRWLRNRYAYSAYSLLNTGAKRTQPNGRTPP